MKKTLMLFALFTSMACNKNLGDAIPSFSLQTMQGERVTSDDLKDKATVIAVWATWCGDCIREIPELNALADKYKDNPDVMLLAFSDEDKATVQKSLDRRPFKFKHIVASKEYTDKLFTGVTKHFPQVLVVDKNLKVVFDVTENKKPIFDDLDSQIQQIIGQ